EHFHEPAGSGRSALQRGVLVLFETIAGMPADIRWAISGIAARRERRARIQESRAAQKEPALEEPMPGLEGRRAPSAISSLAIDGQHRFAALDSISFIDAADWAS